MKIEWTRPAVVDLEGTRDYIKKDSDYYAIRFVERIIEAVESLERSQKKGRIVPESEEENIREILFYSYRIIYRVEIERILILTVMHGARGLRRKKPKPWDVI